MKVFDQMTETIMYYIDKAVARLEAEDRSNIDANDRSVLEKLLLIDRRVAIVMAFDMLLAGVDTVRFSSPDSSFSTSLAQTEIEA